MEVILAGYNLDKEFIEQLKMGEVDPDMVLTPETISAAYARISRYPDPVNVLRKKARKSVSRARKSNQKIVFGMGHHSVAEHVLFNFDVLGISRLAIEALEEARLCAYTEKSQRYITLKGDFVTPKEFQKSDLELFYEISRAQNELYFKAFPILLALQEKRHALMIGEDAPSKDALEGRAKEDARFILNMATEGQLGFSPNARNLEYIIRKLRYHPLDEVKELSYKLFEIGSEIAPSLIVLSDPGAFEEQFGREVSDAFLRDGKNSLREMTNEIFYRYSNENLELIGESKDNVTLVDHVHEPDDKIIAALLYSVSGLTEPYYRCLRIAQDMGRNEQLKFIKQALEKLTEYDAVFREFEHATFTFEVVVSSSEFAQWKRHRMMTLTKQPYEPDLGYTYPEAVIESGIKADYKELYERTTEAFLELSKRYPAAAEYILTNGHRRRLLITANMRELYHIARLRMDEHAQWEIRQTASNMINLITKVAPVTVGLACGKSQFADLRARVF